MPSARRRLRLMLLGLAAVLGGAAALGWLVNPFGLWPTRLVDRRYRSGDASSCTAAQRERVTMPYRLRLEEPQVLLLGSSRVQCGMAMPMDASDGFLNAALRGASTAELAALLDLSARNPRLRRVIVGLDFFASSAGYPAFQDADMPARVQAPLASLWADAIGELRRGLLTVESVIESLRVLSRLARGAPKLALLHGSPWTPEEIRGGLASPPRGLDGVDDAAVRHGLANLALMYIGFDPAPGAADVLRVAIEAQRARGIEVTPVVMPFSACELAMLRRLGLWEAFVAWQRALPGRIGAYWDFSLSPTAAREEKLFADTVHLRPAAGQAVLRRVLGLGCEDCGVAAAQLAAEGVLVDAATVDAHLVQAERQLAALPATRCAGVVAALPSSPPT